MKAIRIHSYGPASEMKLEEVPIPTCGESDILIRVAASGVNPIDWKIRAGFLSQDLRYHMPVILGQECAGIVDAVGKDVTAFKAGDAVYTMVGFDHTGTYAEYVAVDASRVALMPTSLSFNEAASMPLTALAAWTAIEATQLKPGRQVLIHGGGGGVGSLAVQFAKRLGAHITTTVSTKDKALVEELGAHSVIDYQTTDFSSMVGNMDAVIDTVGGNVQEASWKTLMPGRTLVALTEPPSQEQAAAHDVKAEFIFTQPSGETLARIASLIDVGAVKPLPIRSYDLSQAAGVHERGEGARLSGRTILRVAQ
jgi:NADPH:quinone reductase-like Zn-dependent oxidoreductase